MKRKIVLLMLLALLFITGCKKTSDEKRKISVEHTKHIEEPIIEEEKYVDNNPIKLGFYLNDGNVWNKVNEYYSSCDVFKVINWFNVFFTNEQQLPYYGIKGTWKKYYDSYQNISDYRIGYEVSFKLKNGQLISETFTSPKGVYEYAFSKHVYAWVYDDITTTANWYSHLERNDFTKNTLLSSIKLMSTEITVSEVEFPISLTVFTYNSENDFDPYTGKYRGNSKSTLLIKYK